MRPHLRGARRFPPNLFFFIYIDLIQKLGEFNHDRNNMEGRDLVFLKLFL